MDLIRNAKRIEIGKPKQIRDFTEIFDLENMHIWNNFFGPLNGLYLNTETNELELVSPAYIIAFRGDGIVEIKITEYNVNKEMRGKSFLYDTHLNHVPFGDRLAEILGSETAIKFSYFLTPVHKYQSQANQR